jgi:hypothetical protein
VSVVGVGEGSATVVATAGGLRAELRYAVVRPVARSLSVLAADGAPLSGPDSVVVRSPRRYRAQVASNWGPLADRPVTWASSDTAVAVIADDGTLTPRALGTVTLNAAAEDGGLRAAATVVVRPPLAARIAFAVAPDSVRVRRSDSLRVVLYDSAGAPMAVRARVAVEVPPGSGGALATLADAAPGGAGRAALVTGAVAGVVQLVASGDGLTLRRTLPVVTLPQGAPATYPAAVVATPGTSLLLAAHAADLDGYVFVGGSAPTYASADPAVATVSDAGVITARGRRHDGRPGAHGRRRRRRAGDGGRPRRLRHRRCARRPRCPRSRRRSPRPSPRRCGAGRRPSSATSRRCGCRSRPAPATARASPPRSSTSTTWSSTRAPTPSTAPAACSRRPDRAWCGPAARRRSGASTWTPPTSPASSRRGG